MAVVAALANPVVQGVLTDLSIQDTVHDFWDGGRGEANPIDDASLIGFRNGIIALSNPLAKKDITSVTLGEIKPKGPAFPGQWIGKPSDYERNIIRKYEDTYPSHLYSKTKETITYRDILTDKKTGGDALKKKYLANRGYCNIVSIIPAQGEFFDSLDQTDKNIIGNFILTFMFATPGNDNVGAGPYGITYDAGPVAPRKVFADFEQMYNYIYPQNITDSAATSFKSKKIRYIFPGEVGNPKISLVRSNRFTQDACQISFVDKGYTPLNRYGFSWQFKDRSGATIDIPFGPGQSDGPSVNYLVTSILNGGPVNGVREKNTIVNIAPLQPIYALNQGIILDLKRSGDFEQVHASLNNPEAIFATIDHLCSFYARMLHKPCIWSNNASSEIVMYRFDVGPPPTPQEALKREVAYFAQEQVDRIKVLSTLVPGSVERVSIDKALNEFRRGQTAFFLTKSKFSKDQIDYIGNPAAYNPDTVDRQGYIADALATAFLRAKCKDVAEFILSLQTLLATVSPSQPAQYYTTNAALLRLMVSNPELFVVNPIPSGLTVTYTGQPQPVTGIEAIVRTLKTELDGLKQVLDLQSTGQPFYQTLFEDVAGLVVYDHKSNNPIFEFSAGHFKSIHTAIRAMVGILFADRAGRDRGKKAFGFLTDYFTARDALLNTFRNQALAEQIRTLSDIDVSKLTVDDTAIPGLKAMSVDMVKRMFIASIPPRTAGRRKTRKHKSKKSRRIRRKHLIKPIMFDSNSNELDTSQRGGVPPDLRTLLGQTTDLELLFRDICGQAAAYVESVISTNYPGGGVGFVNGGDAAAFTPQNMFKLLYQPAIISVASDIAIRWETELLRIQADALDNYGYTYEPSQTDVFISMLVSSHSSPTGVVIDSYLKSTPTLRRDERGYAEVNQLLTAAPLGLAEVRNLIVLTIFDNMMSGSVNKPVRFFDHLTPLGRKSVFTYAAPQEWRDILGNHLAMVLTSVNSYSLSPATKALYGGERKPLYTPSTTP